ncbi:MAG: phosphatase PAP2 family protein [Verrucomicrobiales bacterium]|nr:phosphatase PAP2 family protein [Verrucomicrobiales bacterium]
MDFGALTKDWGGIKSAIEEGPKGPVFRPFRWVVLPLILLALFSVISRLGNFDLEIQKAIYLAGGNSWDFGERSLWWFLYHFGTIPAAVICGLAVLGFILSLFRDKWKRWRQCFLFVILLGIIGPGVVSNLILKEHWGRPRPRAVEGLGGQSKFEPVLTIDKSSNGKSFPCGHATMGYFFMGGFFLLRRYRRDWAWFFLIFGLCLGFFMGVARMCQGGHFFSDVIWAGAIMYFVAMVLYYDLRLHKGLARDPDNKPVPLWMKVVVPVAGLALMGGILLATPYREVRNYRIITEQGATDPLHVLLTFKAGTISVKPGEKYLVTGEAWGHGVPTSKVAVHFVEYQHGDMTVVEYKERMSGHFTEVEQNLSVEVPWARSRFLTINASDCHVDVELPDEDETKGITVAQGNGTVSFKLKQAEWSWADEADRAKYGEPTDSVNSGSLRIDIQDNFEGKIILNR